MVDSREKGKRGERDFVKWLTERGVTASRGLMQAASGIGRPDIISDIPGVHIEVKFTEHFRPYDWVAQAHRDAVGKTPVVVYRKRNKEWLAIMTAETWLSLVRKSSSST